ncbi:MAG: hypothetical protein M1339_00525 [Bacteroidetes bacterium]|nr:hypothetical protein [Bacteroidota bacterium]
MLGFILHMIPMGIWYTGMRIVALFAAFGRGHSLELTHRLSRTMPVVVPLGINLGIVPLLFTQVGYYQFYYPAGVLMARAWFSVIAVLILAYYGVYIYSLSVRRKKSTTFAVAAAWVSSIAFIFIGFLFANNFSLMVNVENWIHIFERTNIAGASSGTALNTGDPTLVPRWLMMFGLAMTTTAVFIAIDTVFFRRNDTPEDYMKWAGRIAFLLYSIGLVLFAAMGSWYIFGVMERSTIVQVAKDPLVYLIFTLTAVSPGFVLATLLTQTWLSTKRGVMAASILQVLFIALNAISRQWVQSTEIFRYEDVSKLPVNLQWGPMI